MSAGEITAFAFIALVTLGGGLFSALAKRTFHAALGLGAALVGVAMFYILLSAPFIGVLQVLVYVGGILTLLVFAVMFVAGDEEEQPFRDTGDGGPFAHTLSWVMLVPTIAVPLVALRVLGNAGALGSGGLQSFLSFVLFVLIAVFAVRMYFTTWQKRLGVGTAVLLFGVMAAAIMGTQPWLEDGIGGAEDMDAIAQDLFSDHLVAFEVLGVLLTAAMIGALVIARPMVAGMDSDAYKPASAAQLAKSQAVSQLGATFTHEPLPKDAPAAGGEEE